MERMTMRTMIKSNTSNILHASILFRLDKLHLTKDNEYGIESQHNARCPVLGCRSNNVNHPDYGGSFLVFTFRYDKVLIRCFLGCSVEAVVTALGLEMSPIYVKMSSIYGKTKGRRS